MSSQQTQNQFDELPIQQKFPNIIEFFQQYTAYDLMPTSARVLIIDADTSVYRAFRIMGDNATSSAYIYDPKTQLYCAVITATDIMKACILIQNTFFSSEATHDPIEFARRNNIVFENEIGVQDLLQHISVGTITLQQNLVKTYTTTTLLYIRLYLLWSIKMFIGCQQQIMMALYFYHQRIDKSAVIWSQNFVSIQRFFKNLFQKQEQRTQISALLMLITVYSTLQILLQIINYLQFLFQIKMESYEMFLANTTFKIQEILGSLTQTKKLLMLSIKDHNILKDAQQCLFLVRLDNY
ncbi:5'-AMP-activated_protein kinase [Hexamita inflata]|uniref:Gamma-1 subunit n=1 Tax=Hexamita inflata TaxID=28002 RepID=A0AA86TLE8_9EUKA|nr:5'-AMP-activated protein kinase [Hexamita inflata]CAI9978057.1 5'-AMP-activated protein kinase [Hexamita inflata]